MARSNQDTAFGLAGALVVHGLLVVALVVNLDWLSLDPPPVQAELWSSLPPERSPTVSAPAAPDPTPTPTPTPQPDAELALEKRKQEDKKKQALKQKETEKRAQAEKQKAEKQRAEKQRAERQREAQRDAQRIDKERAAELKRLGLDPKAKPADKGKDAATKAGVAAGSARGERTGREAEWADRVKGLLESRVRYRGSNTSDLEVEILLLPTGQLQSVRLLNPSNTPVYDQAVLEAIRTMAFPKPPDGLRAVTLKMRHRAEGL
ncbi:MAG: cell envelope integrity protein TolA [Pseudomonadota bacterium]|jgi:colicin import membrane protein